ncbi:hypothetical protein [Erwinia amylovora]|nr:hypothetical protein [Erwinia amylovora]CDK16319.1 hypothetical protein LA635_2695 [Erwinia amylovora LA635]CDK19685.1 hypothetical protein LA636_2693 [Erwinia amylovora LA636]CDK23057.1 hypothetical protein LA637_2697 [Erwinia amylovora LA637]MCK8157436.1 hypothetical protein [Erwinia amylovora]MCK8160938.1 hypothetical protein [Erwinia amylovora]
MFSFTASEVKMQFDDVFVNTRREPVVLIRNGDLVNGPEYFSTLREKRVIHDPQVTRPAIRYRDRTFFDKPNQRGPDKEEEFMRQQHTSMAIVGKNPRPGTPRDEVRQGLRFFPQRTPQS